MTDSPRRMATRAVHLPAAVQPLQQPLGLPTYRTAAYRFDSAQEFADLLNGIQPGYSYSRIDNPTVDAFAAGVAFLEGAQAGQAFASGMAAISTTLLTFLSAGDHVVAQSQLYGGSYSVLAHVLPRFGVECTFVDGADLEEVAAAIRPGTKLFYGETIANPSMTVADVPALAEIVHGQGALLVLDSTFASPAVCRPLEWGADVVLHSATKYIGGHSDVTGGIAVGSAELMSRVRALRIDLGGSLAPDEAFLLHRGLTTLPLRVARHCASALTVAEALAAHPAVERVDYPGLADHPQHALADKLFDRVSDDTAGVRTQYGGCVTVAPRGGRAAGLAFCDALRLAENASSLGGTHTVVSHVASSTHRQLDDAALLACGILPSAVRISVGLEDVADVVADVVQALESV